ncbi:MAG: GGDEF domain-containing protein [Chloroflexota bacterium]
MRKIIAASRWLVQTRSKQRRAPLLASLLIVLLALMFITMVVVILVNRENPVRGNTYTGLILGLGVLIGIAYRLNRAGHYYWAAGLTVIASILGPGGSLLLDPMILEGDFVPLNFGFIAILLASLFLPPLVTSLLAVLHWVSIIYLFTAVIETPYNWISFLMFTIFASVLSILANIQITRSETELIEQATRDHLTKLFNRRFLDEFLENELQRAVRKKYPVSIIMLDLDHFKQFNDTLGHAAGDALLIGLAEFLSTQVRQHDIVCRYGGEEFVLILPEVSLELAKERSEMLRRQVPEIEVMFDDKTLDAITISIGVAEFNRHGATGEEILKAADAALLQAKQAGRNCVVVAE